MGTSWRTIVTATAMAVAATAGIAAVVDAAPAPTSDPSPVVAISAAALGDASGATAAALPPVSEHALDPSLVAAAQAPVGHTAGQSVTEVIQLTIIGGELSLVTDHASVTLQRVPGSDRDWTGALPAVRVIDARGTFAGWDVEWMLTSLDVQGAAIHGQVPDAKVRVDPAAPAVVDGTPDGLAAGKSGPAVHKGRTLFSAAVGSGGGTYEAGATVSIRLPEHIDADSIVVELAFSVR